MQTHNIAEAPSSPSLAQGAAAYLAAQEGLATTGDSGTEANADQVLWPNAEIINGVMTMRLKFICKGENPRKKFNPEGMESLTNSVLAQGVLQSILIRPKNGVYIIVAGERRYRAATAAFGEDYAIPVLIREMTDAEADAYASSENHEREDMSPVEWARVAAKEVGRAKGDRDEAARVLGWKRSLIDRRLALMNCSEQVLEALTERKILLGHAELLAALAKPQQDKLIPYIVGENKSVAEVKQVIADAACKLDAAIFDKGECAACPHNSSVQKTMFEEAITDGGCTNSACYKAKTETALQGIADGLKDEWPVIRILRVGDNETRIKLVPDGSGGVGVEQAEACRACTNFGAAVSGLPQALGKVFENQCFDTICNATKVEDRIKADTAALEAAAEKPDSINVTKSAGAEQTTASATEKAPPAKPTKVSEGERIKAYREKVWRNAMKQEILQDGAKSRAYLIALALDGAARNIDSTLLNKAFGKVTGNAHASSHDLDQTLTSVAQLTEDNTTTMITLLAASAMAQLDVHKLQQLARHHQLDLRHYWKLDSDFLELLTKSEIEILTKEVGLDAAIGDGFKKLFTEKKPDLIKALLAVESFDYAATIPAVLAY
ncbi:PRTRC system ParB family protein [Rugamonas sp. A1-17]|nr:PRTRC system ParB family protein [Rugamonas sp. A1-17]